MLSFWLFAGCGAGGFGGAGGAGGAGGRPFASTKANGNPMCLALRPGMHTLPVAAAKVLCASVLDPGGRGISCGSSLLFISSSFCLTLDDRKTWQ